MPSPTVNSLSLVLHVDILIIAILACFVLCSLPRAFARFTQAFEWTHGHTLRSVRLDPRRRRTAKYANDRWKELHLLQSDDTHTMISHAYLGQRQTGKDIRMSLPPHVPAWPVWVRPLASILRYRIISGFSVGKMLVLGGYFFILVYASLLDSNVFMGTSRLGCVAMSQIPIVFALTTKNNLVGMSLGLGYEKLNFLHRFAGRMVVVAANLHALGFVYEWTDAGTFLTHINKPSNAWGLVALTCADTIFFFSTAVWRQKAYNIFLSTHIISFSVLLPAIYYHKPSTLYYILTAVFLYALDHFLRLFKTRLCNARIRPLPELNLTRVEMPYLNTGWRAGQHVRIRVLSSGMGWFGWAEAHPFTIASLSKGPEGMVLMCKKSGRWTQKLYELGTLAGYQAEEGGVRRTKVLVEGPYGGPGHTVFASYSAAIFVIGGSGISFALSSIQELVRRDNEASSRLKAIELIWSVQDPSSLTPLIPLLSALIEQSAHTPLRISVFYTRATSTPPSEKAFYGHPNLTLSAGRPRIGKVLDSVISKAASLSGSPKDSGPIMGVIVAVCGPVGLGDDVVKAVGAVDGKRRDAVGGVEIYEENFGY